MQLPPSAKIVLVRHAESAGNEAGVVSGASEFPLTAYGEESTKACQPTVCSWGVRNVVASDLERAWMTAHLLTGSEHVTQDPRLRERSAGPWEMRPRVELEKAFPGALLNDEVREQAGFEPESALTARCLEALKEYVQHEGVTLIVSHGGAARAILRSSEAPSIKLSNLDAVVLDATLKPLAVLSLTDSFKA